MNVLFQLELQWIQFRQGLSSVDKLGENKSVTGCDI